MATHEENWAALKNKKYSELTAFDAAYIHLSQVPFFQLKGCRIASMGPPRIKSLKPSLLMSSIAGE